MGGFGDQHSPQAWAVATLPAAHGGLGLQPAESTAPAAYWAAWADALPVIDARAPDFARRCLAALEDRGGAADCLREAAAARDLLAAEGWHDCFTWSSILQGPHGSQMHASHSQHTLSRQRATARYAAEFPSASALPSRATRAPGSRRSRRSRPPPCHLPQCKSRDAASGSLCMPLQPLHGATCGPNPGCGAV